MVRDPLSLSFSFFNAIAVPTWVQCNQIGRVLKFLHYKFSHKVAQISGDFWATLKTVPA